MFGGWEVTLFDLLVKNWLILFDPTLEKPCIAEMVEVPVRGGEEGGFVASDFRRISMSSRWEWARSSADSKIYMLDATDRIEQ